MLGFNDLLYIVVCTWWIRVLNIGITVKEINVESNPTHSLKPERANKHNSIYWSTITPMLVRDLSGLLVSEGSNVYELRVNYLRKINYVRE